MRELGVAARAEQGCAGQGLCAKGSEEEEARAPGRFVSGYSLLLPGRQAKILNFGSFGHVSFSCLCAGFPHLPVWVLMKGGARRLVWGPFPPRAGGLGITGEVAVAWGRLPQFPETCSFSLCLLLSSSGSVK